MDGYKKYECIPLLLSTSVLDVIINQRYQERIELTIIVDDREPSRIVKELEYSGVPVEVRRLDVGDYIVGRFVLERKSNEDFSHSIYTNRIFKQLWNLQNIDESLTPGIVVIGDIPPKHRWERIKKRRVKVLLTQEEKEGRERAILSGIATVWNSYGRVLFLNVPLERQFITFLVNLYRRQNKRESKPPVLVKKGKTPKDIKRNILSCLPGIGSKRADKLAKSITISQLCSMTEEDIVKTFKGIGKKRAKIIREALNA